MCGRYRRTTREEELARLYHIPIPKQTDLSISYNIAPSQKVLTIRFNPQTQHRSLDALQWGLIPYWARDPKIAYRTINARDETVDKAPSFRLSGGMRIDKGKSFAMTQSRSYQRLEPSAGLLIEPAQSPEDLLTHLLTLAHAMDDLCRIRRVPSFLFAL